MPESIEPAKPGASAPNQPVVSVVAAANAVKSVGGGVALTVLTIGLLELVSQIWFKIPQPSALYLLAVTAATLLGGMRSGLISALIVFAFSAYITHLPGVRPFPAYDGDQRMRLLLFGITAPSMAILIGVLRRRNDELLRRAMRQESVAERAAEQAAAAARQATIDLEREHRIAATLQNVLLSPLPPETAFPTVGIGYCYEAASSEAEVGGDFYDLIVLDGATIAVIVGDVSGKGLAAAAKTAEVKYTLRAVLHGLQARPTPQASVALAQDALARLNHVLGSDLRHGSGVIAPSPVVPAPVAPLPAFVCLSLALLDTATGAGALAVAGMEPPIILRERPDGITGEILTVGGFPIGVTPDAAYDALAFHLAPGDTLLLTTDGVTESRRSGSAHLFGIDGLCRAAETIFAPPADVNDATSPTSTFLNERAAQIVAAAKTFAGTATLKDDACVLVVRRR